MIQTPVYDTSQTTAAVLQADMEMPPLEPRYVESDSDSDDDEEIPTSHIPASRHHHAPIPPQMEPPDPDIEIQPKPPAYFRISCINRGGITTANAEATFQHALDLDIDIQGYSETNIDTNKYHVRNRLTKAALRLDPQAKSTWSTSEIHSTSTYKPGGTSLIAFGHHTGRLKAKGRDTMGRWSYMLLDAKGDRDVLILSIYQCCVKPTNADGKAAFHQQQKMFLREGRNDLNPRTNFYKDLKQFIRSQLAANPGHRSVIIMGDWNEQCQGNSNSNKLCHDFGLVDLWNVKHPNTELSTYKRGSRRIDFALVSQDIANMDTHMIYEPFDYRLSGDHRGFIIDIPMAIFGTGCPPIYDPSGRGFQSNDRKAAATYLRAFYDHITEHDIINRIRTLIKHDSPDHETAEAIDREITRAGKHAENQCRRRRRDYWNVDLHLAKLRLSVWIQYRRRTTRKLPTNTIIERAATFGIIIPPDTTIGHASQMISTLKAEIKQMRINSRAKRRDHLLDRANLAEDMEDHKVANILREMYRAERKNEVYAQLRYVRGKSQASSGITRLQVPKSWPSSSSPVEAEEISLEDPKTVRNPSDWIEVNCPKEIEFLIRIRNQRHFGQAETEGTPFTQEPLKHRFNWSASTREAELVLEGEYSSTDIDDISRLLLDNLTRVTDLDSVPAKVTVEQMKGKYSKWNEATSTSPSGRHLGHYKVLFKTVDRTCSPPERQALREIQDDIAHMYVSMINYAIKHRYSYQRWKQIVSLMIYKEPGNVKIHRLRVIHLFENDLNFLLGIKWGQCLHKAQQDNNLHSGQYGSRPGRDPHAVTLMEELRLDYSLLTRTPYCNFDNDASSCYDRILLALSSLAARGLGMHRDIVFIHASTLQEAEYKLKMGKNISDSSYKHCIAFPLHGSGQGSTASPMIWCFISCKLFQCHQAKAYGMIFTSPNLDIALRISIVGFVDDSTCITSGDPTKPIEDLLQRMQHDAQLWNDLLWTSGGKLELPKCGFHAIYYKFDTHGLPVMVHQTHQSITIVNAHGAQVPIKEKNIYTPRKNLGHYKAPAGQYKVQTDKILEKARQLADAIAKCDIQRSDAKLLYDSVFRPAVEYPIPQSFLSRKQLQHIERKSLPQIFAKCGFMRNTHRKILFGPEALGGGGFVPLYAIAGSGYIQHFLKHWRTPKEEAGTLLRIVVAWSQYQAGVSYPLLLKPATNLPHVQGRLIHKIREYLTAIGGTIDISPTFTPEPLRKRDKALMEHALALNIYTAHQIRKINTVRMFLGVFYLSELTTITGTHIAQHAIDPDYLHPEYIHTKGKVYQRRPPLSSWALWENFLNTFTQDGNTLRHPLGNWKPTHSSRGLWKSYLDPRAHQVFVHNDDEPRTWQKYNIDSSKTLRLAESNISFEPMEYQPPIPVFPTAQNSLKIRPAHTRLIRIPPAPDQFTDWTSLITAQPAWAQQYLTHITFQSIDDILGYLRTNEEIMVVSDGSAQQSHMAYGWIASLDSGHRFVKGNGPCDGRPSSLRSEAAGMLAATLFFAMLQEWTLFEFPSIELHFFADNMELIQRQIAHQTYTDPYPNATMKAEFDLIEQIYLTISIYRIKAHFCHVKGHQDDNCSYRDLPLESQLNVDADHLATQYYSTGAPSTPQVSLLKSCPAVLSLRNISITNDYHKQLLRAYTEPEYIGYLQDKFHWSDPTVEIIAWRSLSCAIRRIQRPSLTTKICNDILPVATTLMKWRHQPHDRCCLCGAPETTKHLFTCTAPSRIQWRIRLISSLRRCMLRYSTCPGLMDTLCNVLTDWLDTQTVSIDKYPVKYHPAIITQQNIGWQQIFMGKLSQEWEKLQGPTCNPAGAPRSPHLWSTSIVETALRLTIDLWTERNADLHGRTYAEQNAALLTKHRAEINRLNELRPQMQPSDTIILDHVDQLLTNDKATDLGDWITTNRPLIYQSIKKAHITATSQTRRIYSWFPPVSTTGLATIKRWARDRLIFDPFSKKKRHKEPAHGIQTTLTRNLSLRQIL